MISVSRVLVGKVQFVGTCRQLGTLIVKNNRAFVRRALPSFRNLSNNVEKHEQGNPPQTEVKSGDNKVVRFDDDEYDDYEPKTAGQKVDIQTFILHNKLV